MFETIFEKRYPLGNVFTPLKITTILVRVRGRHQDCWKKELGLKCQILASIWKPYFLMKQLYLGCTQGEARVDDEAVQAMTDLFRRYTSIEVTNEEQHTK